MNDLPITLFSVPSRVQVVIVEHGVEDQKKTPRGLGAPHGVVSEQNDMPLAMRHIDHDPKDSRRLYGSLAVLGIAEKTDCYLNQIDHTVSTLVWVMDEANRRRFAIQARP